MQSRTYRDVAHFDRAVAQFRIAVDAMRARKTALSGDATSQSNHSPMAAMKPRSLRSTRAGATPGHSRQRTWMFGP